MKLQKVLVPIVAVVCILAARTASAGITNIVTFKATTFEESTVTSDGTSTTFGAVKTSSHDTAQLIGQLGSDTSNNFSSAAKLALIDNTFVVIDGTNIVDVSAIVSISFGNNSIKSGKKNDSTGLASPSLKELQVVTLTFDDTNPSIGGDLQFSLQGIANATEADTTPSGGVYTESLKAKVTSMTGEGSSGGKPFVATGSLSVSGRGSLVLPP
jgi:hypothetical protein